MASKPPPDNVVPFRRRPLGGSGMPRFPRPRWLPSWLFDTATGWLILANTGIWLVMVVVAQRAAIGAGIIQPFSGAMTLVWGSNVPPLDITEPWRLITSAFLHANLMHIAGNMFLLWYVGQRLEGAFGRGRFLVLYMAAALGGSVMSFGWHWVRGGSSVGASGAIMGLCGGLLALSWRGFGRGHPVTRMWIQYSALGFVLPIVSNLLGASVIDNAAHFGGWLAGIGVALAFVGKPPFSSRVNALVTATTAVVVAGCFALSLTIGGGVSELVGASVPASMIAAQKAYDAEDWPAADEALARAMIEEPHDLALGLMRASVLDRLNRRDDARAVLVSAVDLVSDATPNEAGNLADQLLEHDAPKPARKAAAIAQYKDPGNRRWKEIYDRAVAADH